MLVEALLVMTFAAQGTQVDVHTDSNPGHWREWTVLSTGPLSGEERCQYRVDASRVLRGMQVTQGLPSKCMTATTRKRRPDPAR